MLARKLLVPVGNKHCKIMDGHIFCWYCLHLDVVS